MDLQFRGAYTFSKSLDEGSSLANAISRHHQRVHYESVLNVRQDYGLSSFDIRHIGFFQRDLRNSL